MYVNAQYIYNKVNIISKMMKFIGILGFIMQILCLIGLILETKFEQSKFVTISIFCVIIIFMDGVYLTLYKYWLTDLVIDATISNSTITLKSLKKVYVFENCDIINVYEGFSDENFIVKFKLNSRKIKRLYIKKHINKGTDKINNIKYEMLNKIKK